MKNVRLQLLILLPYLCLLCLGIFQSSPVYADTRLSDYVNTLRGSNNDGGGYSRGNTIPLTTRPHGFSFWTPKTNAQESGWPYQWKDQVMQGFSVSHIPSPWIGEYASFNIMPEIGTMKSNNTLRGIPYSHKDEIGLAHYYAVTLKNGIKVEMAPTSHACIMRITFPASTNAHILFDTKDNATGSVIVDSIGHVLTGNVLDINNGWFQSIPKNYFYISVDKDIKTFGYPINSGVCANIDFATTANEVVILKIGTSYLSVAQAQANLNTEIGSKDLETVKEEGAAEWDKLLGKIEIEGATEDQKTTFYSCMYREFAYPNAMWENVNGVDQYYSPYDGKVHTGKIYVNNGFWDTYKASWPLYGILTPTQAGDMLDGFVTPFKQIGSVPRWSGPGILGAMVSSHSDVIFADAYVKGIRNFDYATAYQSMMKNSSASNGSGATGRTANEYANFCGYVPQDIQAESASWTIENNICDASIAQMAKAMGNMDDYTYFSNKSLGYTNLFSTSVGGFFRGKNLNGSWRTTDANYKPNEWGYENCEGNAWQYRFAPVFDGQGLANLFNGRANMEAKIDEIFNAPKDYLPGSYGGAIHEMKEAYDSNTGQYNHDNATDHSLIYMYNYAGAPAKTALRARDVMTRLYNSGIGTGNGYCGDEDNGSMSAWYVLSASGFFPACGAVPEYLIGSPLYSKITYHLEDGKTFVVSAPNNSSTNIYVQSATLNGNALSKNFITHSDIINGGTLVLNMGAAPSSWGTGPNDVPTSLTTGTVVPQPLKDCTANSVVTASGQASAAEGFAKTIDNNSKTKWVANTNTGWIQYQLPQPAIVSMYTLTSGNDNPNRDPKSWNLMGSKDGINWDTLDTRTAQTFTWRMYTRNYSFKNTTPYQYYRLGITQINGGLYFQISEIELFETNANYVQNNWRWRNDDGNEQQASWLELERTPVTVKDTSMIVRLRLRLDMRSEKSGVYYNNLMYSTQKYSSFFDMANGSWNKITNNPEGSAFVLTNSPFLSMGDVTTKQLSNFIGNTADSLLSDTLKFLPGAVFLPGVNEQTISSSNFTEVEYCLKASKNILPNTNYYFWLSPALVSLNDQVTLPSIIYDFNLGASVVKENKGIQLYPNPIVKDMNISFSNPCNNTTISIFDMVGRLMMATKFNNENSLITVNTSSLSNGVYFVHINRENIHSIYTVIKNAD